MSLADLHRVVLASDTNPEDFLKFRDGMTSKDCNLKHPGRPKAAGLIRIVTRLSTGYIWKKGPCYERWRKYYEKKSATSQQPAR